MRIERIDIWMSRKPKLNISVFKLIWLWISLPDCPVFPRVGTAIAMDNCAFVSGNAELDHNKISTLIDIDPGFGELHHRWVGTISANLFSHLPFPFFVTDKRVFCTLEENYGWCCVIFHWLLALGVDLFPGWIIVEPCCLTSFSHRLYKCWLIIRDVLWHSLEYNFEMPKIPLTWDSKLSI